MSKAIIGIGNNGKKYSFTRHNIAWILIDRCVKNLGAQFVSDKMSIFAKYFIKNNSEPVYFVKFKTFVNTTGPFLLKFMKDKNILPQDILVISDDVHLPLGSIRIRPRGSHGGHNGLRSLIDSLKTSEFPRLRLGVGVPDSLDLVEHVLGKFSIREMKILEDVFPHAQDAVQDFFVLDWQKLMSRYNRSLTSTHPNPSDQ